MRARAISEAVGLTSLGQGFRESRRIAARVDAQATSGRTCRGGIGKARHIEAAYLWIQGSLKEAIVGCAREITLPPRS